MIGIEVKIKSSEKRNNRNNIKKPIKERNEWEEGSNHKKNKVTYLKKIKKRTRNMTMFLY